jgi:hypothetical protein
VSQLSLLVGQLRTLSASPHEERSHAKQLLLFEEIDVYAHIDAHHKSSASFSFETSPLDKP